MLVWDAGERSQQPIFFIYLFCLLYIFVINTFSGFSVPVSVFNKWAGNSGGPCTIGPWVARIAHYHTSPQPVVLESGPTWHGHTPPPSSDPIQSNYLPSLHCTYPATPAALPGSRGRGRKRQRACCSSYPETPSNVHGYPPPGTCLRGQPAAWRLRRHHRHVPLRGRRGTPLPPRPQLRRRRRQSQPVPLQDPSFPQGPPTRALH